MIVVFRMPDTGSTRSHLNVSPLHRLDIAHAVFVAELAGYNVREDLGLSMWVGGEALLRLTGISALKSPRSSADSMLTSTRSSLMTLKAPKLSHSSSCHEAKEKV